MAIFIAVKLGPEFFHLLFDHSYLGAIDLKFRYIGSYDDFLIIFPMVAFFRIAKGTSRSNGDIKAAVLLGSAVVIMVMPIRMLYFWDWPWPVLFTWTHSLIWLAALVFLLIRARTEMRSQAVPAKPCLQAVR